MSKFFIPLVGLLFLCCWAAMAEAEYLKYEDPKQGLNVRIRDLMKRMTLEEKIGQMMQLDVNSTTPEIVRDYLVGSVLSGGGHTPGVNATVAEWINMVNTFQNGSLNSRLGILMIYGIDAVHGHNNVYGATIFPHNVGLGATRDLELVKSIGAATASEVRATGIPYAFAPCIAVCRDPRWGRCYESYCRAPNPVAYVDGSWSAGPIEGAYRVHREMCCGWAQVHSGKMSTHNAARRHKAKQYQHMT